MAKTFSNQEVARLLREISAAYEVKGDKFFQSRAYDTAAESIDQAPALAKDLWEQDRLQSLPGVGGSIAQHLDELFRTGEVKHFKEVKKGLPPGMFNFLGIQNVGPKTAYKLAKELHLKTLQDLKEACQNDRVAQLEGFGQKSQEKILRSLEQFMAEDAERMLLPFADNVAQKIAAALQELPSVKQIDTLGSLRRMKPTVGDVDLAVQSNQAQEVIDFFVARDDVGEILNQGSVKASVQLKDGTQVDLRVQEEKSYGALLQYFTGSKEHNIHLRELAMDRDLSLSEYGIRQGGKEGRLIEFATEEEFYEHLDLPWIPPEMREDNGEIEAAQQDNLPELVKLDDIRGDLHVHCNFDLEESHDAGHASIEELAQRGIELGYQYISIGNHSPSISRHNQAEMAKLIQDKQEEIDKVQENYPQIKLLNVVEVDILADNTLALNNNNLRRLDVAIAGVHSSLGMARPEMTKRVLVALNNPHVHGLAHPTGRLLNEREGYELDWEQVFQACKDNGKFLEVNAYYKRLDLPGILVREAIQNGVKLAINTDAHDLKHLELMKYGVATARRGWAEKDDVLNTLSWKELRQYLQ